ncbi:MAG TPA: hypothetical protein VI977_04170 [archaeon]|nr:hypothetical protein [archaeon]
MLSKSELLAALDNALRFELEEGVSRYSAIIRQAPDAESKKILEKLLRETKQHALTLVQLKFLVLEADKNGY